MNFEKMNVKRLERKKQRILEKAERNYLLLAKAFKKEIIKQYILFENKNASYSCCAEPQGIYESGYRKILDSFEFYDFNHEKFQSILSDCIENELNVKPKHIKTRFEIEKGKFWVYCRFED